MTQKPERSRQNFQYQKSTWRLFFRLNYPKNSELATKILKKTQKQKLKRVRIFDYTTEKDDDDVDWQRPTWPCIFVYSDTAAFKDDKKCLKRSEEALKNNWDAKSCWSCVHEVCTDSSNMSILKMSRMFQIEKNFQCQTSVVHHWKRINETIITIEVKGHVEIHWHQRTFSKF